MLREPILLARLLVADDLGAMTPQIPDWIRHSRVNGYRNIYELCPEETRVYGTESLCGDWSGDVLLLLKDFASSDHVKEKIARGERGFSHTPKLPTNRRLNHLLSPVRLTAQPETCGVLYGSALAGLLRDDGEMSGDLSNRREAMENGVRVLRWVVDQMPCLRIIVPLGVEACETTEKALGRYGDRDKLRKQPRPDGRLMHGTVNYNGREVLVVCGNHPARWGHAKLKSVGEQVASLRRNSGEQIAA